MTAHDGRTPGGLRPPDRAGRGRTTARSLLWRFIALMVGLLVMDAGLALFLRPGSHGRTVIGIATLVAFVVGGLMLATGGSSPSRVPASW